MLPVLFPQLFQADLSVKILVLAVEYMAGLLGCVIAFRLWFQSKADLDGKPVHLKLSDILLVAMFSVVGACFGSTILLVVCVLGIIFKLREKIEKKIQNVENKVLVTINPKESK